MIESNDFRACLSAFDPISLEELGAAALMDRVETKFILSVRQLPELLEHLHADYSILEVSGKRISSYQTAYLDTEKLHCYHEHHRRRKKRYKLRFRKYVDSDLNFFELKRKDNGRIDKRRMRLETDEAQLGDMEAGFLQRSEIDPSGWKQKLLNRYQRITLVSKHQTERVTLDLNIEFSHDGVDEQLGDLVILELKQAKASRKTPVYKALRRQQIRPFNISKYCIGLIKTHGQEKLKHNRFKKKLLKIAKINHA
jgi:hypothetical protein